MNTAEKIEALKSDLMAAGFKIETQAFDRDNLVRWYAWRRLPTTIECTCNDKPPSLVVQPHRYVVSGHPELTGVEMTVTGETFIPSELRLGQWFKLSGYGIAIDKAMERLPAVERALTMAWVAVNG